MEVVQYGFTSVGGGRGLTQENRRNVGGSACMRPQLCRLFFRLKPEHPVCVHRAGMGGRNCLNMPLKIHTSYKLYKHMHTCSPSCVAPFRSLISLLLFPPALSHSVNECADSSFSSAWLSTRCNFRVAVWCFSNLLEFKHYTNRAKGSCNAYEMNTLRAAGIISLLPHHAELH